MSQNTTIQSINIRPVVVPMDVPHRTASGVIFESPLALIDVTTSEGVVGHSIVFAYTVAALKPITEFLTNIKPLIVNQALAPIEIQQSLNAKFRLLGTQGLVGMALAGVDMAIWDALARSKEMSLIKLLGSVEKPILAYGAVGYEGEIGSAKQAEDWANRGIKGVKAKIGYPTVQEDIRVIQAMRCAVGDDVAIMVDYNQSLSPTQAIERTKLLDHEGLTWIEEPTLAHDYEGHAEISKQTSTMIQSGENWWGVLDVKHAIQAKSSDYVMLDVMKVGGVSGWMKASALAEVNSIPVSSHLWSELSACLLSCTPTAHWLEYCDWWNPILQNPLFIDQQGYAHPNASVGRGIEWDESVVKQCLK
jgi:mandelate racemase